MKPRVPSSDLLATLREQGGMTFSEKTQKHVQAGVVASRYGSEEVSPQHSPASVSRYRNLNMSQFSDTVHLGGWADPVTGEEALDISHQFDTREDALSFGKQNLQKAVFDLGDFSTHYVDYGKGPGIATNSLEHALHTEDAVQGLRREREGKSGVIHRTMAESLAENEAKRDRPANTPILDDREVF